MNRKKLLAVIISLVLAIAVVLPGTLAISADQDSSQSTLSVDTEPTPSEPEPPAEPEPSAPGEQPADETSEQPAEEPTAPTECTCGASDGAPHQEGCPLYTAPEAPVEETGEETAGEPTLPLYDRLMAASTAEEFTMIVDSTPIEEISALTGEEFDAVDAYYIFLTTGAYPDYSPVVDEVMEIVDYTYVAPLGDPVIGGQG